MENSVTMKIVMVGAQAVGKTNLLTRLVHDEFNLESERTRGVEFAECQVDYAAGVSFHLHIWDAAGKRGRPQAACQAYYRNAVGVILVYDTTRHDTFSDCQYFADEIDRFAHRNCIRALVATKADLVHLRDVSEHEGRLFADAHNMLFYEVSSLDAANVDDAFLHVAERIYERHNANSAHQKSHDDSSSPSSSLSASPSTPPLSSPASAAAAASTASLASATASSSALDARAPTPPLPLDKEAASSSRFATPITSFDVHVYFDENDVASVSSARLLRDELIAEFPDIPVFNMHYRPIGPHPTAMFEAHVRNPLEFGQVVPWLCLHRREHAILVHPHTGNGLNDHTHNAVWLGTPQTLSLGIFKKN
jgi:Ras-related protein Rab-11A